MTARDYLPSPTNSCFFPKENGDTSGALHNPFSAALPSSDNKQGAFNGCSTLINLTQLIWGMLGYPAWPAQNNISSLRSLQQHPWTGTQGRVITNYVHKTFPQALSKLLISCSGSSDIVSCLVTWSSFFEIIFYSSLQPVGFILFIFGGDGGGTYILEDRIAFLCTKDMMGKRRWELHPFSN